MKICVFLSSAEKSDPAHIKATKELAQAIVHKKHELVYGGTKLGLMAILADEVLKLGGKVTGVISKEFDNKDIIHNNLTNLHMAKDMNERIMKQINISDIFVMLPGGIGTFDEFFKIWTLKKVQKIKKPLAILNIDKLFDPLIAQIHALSAKNIIKKSEIESIDIYNDVASLFNNYEGMK